MTVQKIGCCARKLKGENRRIFTPPKEWKNKAYALTQFNELSMAMEIEMPIKIKEANSKGYVEINEGECFDSQNSNSNTRRGRKMTEKSNCLMANEKKDFMRYEGDRIIMLHGKPVKVLGIRRLTPTERARLQTIPTWYKWECSDSQAYRLLGNGWCVAVIVHIFSFLPFKREA